MLIKEYRIPLPLTVEEYRIAQLYMLQKKSREESEGEGSAVEILQNHPYTNGPNGSGQYTYKVFHIGRHLPGWFRGIAPKTALEVHEEAWNAYPYTKTRFSVPFVDKFSIELETYYESDGGTQDNKFSLTPSELRRREVDVIDIVNDQLSGNDYKKEEDPRIYVSQKNGRGPLKEDWISNPPNGTIMCSYKLIKVEFRYWGLQSKIERFIHDYALRRVMLRAHRQAWAWQDEWVGLTIEDIRALERETQLILQKKLGRSPSLGEMEEPQEENEEEEEDSKDKLSSATGHPPLSARTSAMSTPTTPSSIMTAPSSATPPGARQNSFRKDSMGRPNSVQGQSSMENWERRRSSVRRLKTRGSVHSIGSGRSGSIASRKHSNASIRAGRSGSEASLSKFIVGGDPAAGEYDDGLMRPEWALDQIELSDSDSDLEFFDAKETVEGGEESPDEETEVPSSTTCNKEPPKSPSKRANDHLWNASFGASFDASGDEMELPSLPEVDMKDSSSPDILFLVLHGGSIMDPISDRVGKTLDFSTLQTNIKTIAELHFHSAIGRIATRLVPCKNICNTALDILCKLSPVPVTKMQSGEGLLPRSSLEYANAKVAPSSSYLDAETRDAPSFLPIGSIPLIATQCHTYREALKKAARVANHIYREFLQSEEGLNFNGQVCLIGDCMGSVIGYDILTSMQPKGTPTPPSPSSSPQQPLHAFSPQNPQQRQRKTSAAVHASGYSVGQQQVVSGESVSPSKMRGRVYTANSSISVDKGNPTPPHLLFPLNRKEPSLGSLNSDSNTSINIDYSSGEPSFSFEVSHFFTFGSPLGLILASRRAKSRRTAANPPPPPPCLSFYNIFYGVDTIASRIEPILDQRFAKICPISVPNYRAFPTGAEKAYSLKDTVVQHPFLFMNQRLPVPMEGRGNIVRKKAISTECLTSLDDDASENVDTTADIKPFSVWWSSDRIDYMLEAPWGKEAFEMLPPSAFSHIVHSRYWEAKELVSFILRQVLHHEVVCVKERGDRAIQVPLVPRESVVKWKRKSTSVRINRLRPNHWAADVVALEGTMPPAILAKFQYGPLSMASLCKEEVEVYINFKNPKPMWEFIGSGLTNKHGKMMYSLPEDMTFSPGLYSVKFLVKGDHTTAGCNLFVVPPHIEAVVFSVDGALASNLCISAKDMKPKQGAVEVARSWQELGYLIIYISGRLADLQKDYILKFLGCHGFPLGLLFCADSFSADAQSVKTAYLARLIKQAKMIIHAGYGSSRHLGVYKELGLQPDQIYIHGRKSKGRRPSDNCQYLFDGFSSHHSDIVADPPRKAMHDAREWFGEACFALPGNETSANHQKKARQSKRSSSYRSQKSISIESQSGSRLAPRGPFQQGPVQTEV